jgi:hypothetical protein
MKKRKYARADDQIFLDRMRQGTLWVDPWTQTVFTSISRQNFGRFVPLKLESDHKGYLHVRCYQNGKRKSITLVRLIWMALTGRKVPEGFHIDHWDHDHSNNDPGNLRLREALENSTDNGRSENDF